MPSYLQIENISKSYGTKVLFDHISFNINEGDKVALIAPNGTGKTSLLKILAGRDSSDSGGKVLFMKDIRIAFLEQDYDYDPEKSIFRQIMDHSAHLLEGQDEDHRWAYELRVRQFLSQFSLEDVDKPMKSLSGGEVKRVALSEMLASEADFYIMDEPTNHLDIDAIEFLAGHLRRARCTLFMVTHDRYFLDRVCNSVMEMDRGQVYIYRGDYYNFLEKRQERIDNYNAETERVRNLFRRELEWMHATPCARTGKAKYRKQAFWDIKQRAEDAYVTRNVNLDPMQARSTYLGNKVIDCHDVSFWWDHRCYLSHFSYKFQRYDRVGIVGRNAAGKSTFLSLLTGGWTPEMGGEMVGVIERGESLRIGWYKQEGMEFKPGQTVMETVQDTHLLGQFLFPHETWTTPVERLSGGERRRLYLLTVLKQQPNLLILDEPTNDLDIVTLELLEEYLIQYKGSLIIVSHDRHFLDRLVDHLFVFCGDGVVKDFIGNYTEYRSFIKDYESEQRAAALPEKAPIQAAEKPARQVKARLTWKEQQELKALDEEIPRLETEKAGIEADLSSGNLTPGELQRASQRYAELQAVLDEKELRWLELSERQE